MIIPGFRFAATAAGLKKTGALDLALLVADEPAAAAGVFTTNRVKAAPVVLSQERLRAGKAQAILVNAGNANACTGPEGLEDARETTLGVADLLKIPERLVLPASTGVIGQPLPLAKITQALPKLTARLNPQGFPEAAEAIMTTDTRPKTALLREKIDGKEVTLAGMAKGAGMIHPDMATLLVFIFTDAAATPKVLKTLLRRALPVSFNRITVDGDTSTNDTILLLAGGRAGNPVITEDGPAMAALGEMLNQVMGDLASQVVADGEGARHMFRVEVRARPPPARPGRRPHRGPLPPGEDRHGRRGRQLGPHHGGPGALRGPLRPRAGGDRLRRRPGGPERPGPGPRGRSPGAKGHPGRGLQPDHRPE